MTIIFVSGDLFADPSLDGLAHGCNCVGAMGAGIAMEFRRRYPEMYLQYKKHCDSGDFVPGTVFVCQPPMAKAIGLQLADFSAATMGILTEAPIAGYTPAIARMAIFLLAFKSALSLKSQFKQQKSD
jgi:hypothetical protein